MGYPLDLTTDTCGRVYVVDHGLSEIVLYSDKGKFLKKLTTDYKEVEGDSVSFFLQNDRLYVTTVLPNRVIVVQLE